LVQNVKKRGLFLVGKAWLLNIRAVFNFGLFWPTQKSGLEPGDLTGTI